MSKFTEAKLEQAFIELLEKQNIPYTTGHLIDRNEHEVLIKDDLRNYLHRRYDDQGISDLEIDKILLQLESLSALDLYESNKKLMRMLSDGFILKREDPDDKDLYIELIDYSGMTPYRQPEKDQMLSISDHKASYEGSRNMYRMVNQMEIIGDQKRIPDGILYINGLPLVVFEFKTAIEENCTIHNAYEQLTIRYKRDIPELFKYNAFCVISVGSEQITQEQRDQVHFYLAVRSILIKITKGDAPDAARMNAKVREMIQNALASEGIEEIYKIGEGGVSEEDLFSEDYLARIDKIKLPNTKIKLLQKLLAKAIDEFRKTNRAKAIDFSKRMESLVKQYNERKADKFRSEVLDDFTNEIMDLFKALQKEKESFKDMGIDFEEKAFYDILKSLAHKYDFTYPEEKLLILSKEVKTVVDDKAKYTDWSHRDDIKAELKADLIVLLAKHNYPPVDRDEVYKEIFEQAENFKRSRK
jgi:type I site-specific restriction-modification system R (restriction) subunit